MPLLQRSEQELRILGQGRGAIAIELKDRIYAPLHDFHENVVALTDLSGATVLESFLPIHKVI